jgi:hypothetical protein
MEALSAAAAHVRGEGGDRPCPRVRREGSGGKPGCLPLSTRMRGKSRQPVLYLEEAGFGIRQGTEIERTDNCQNTPGGGREVSHIPAYLVIEDPAVIQLWCGPGPPAPPRSGH